ncbi:MAG: B12-binding domain-containing radical SAM protein [Theionarchaea archaeon]|nr:B12-binding domain-containing radical SAM protein [Theionarchaea archaeon]
MTVRTVLCNPAQPVYYVPHIPPLGMSYLGSYLREHGQEVFLLDFEHEATSMGEQTLNRLVDMACNLEPDIIGFTAWADCMPFISEFLKRFRQRAPDCVTVLGGPLPSVAPAETLKFMPLVDYVVVGEGERVLLELVQHIEKGKSPDIEGVCYRKGESLFYNPQTTRVNVETLPLPAYDLLPPLKDYTGGGDPVVLTMAASRGCIYNCTFCSSKMMWGTYRCRSVSSVVDEVASYVRAYGDIFIDFLDDIFTAYPTWVKAFCRRLQQQDLEVKWSCITRVDRVSRELLKDLKDAGCRIIFYGVDSGTQRILNQINKGYKVEDVTKAIRMSLEFGFSIENTFIINFPTETRQEMMETLKLARTLMDMGVEEAVIFILTPHPHLSILDSSQEYVPTPYRDGFMEYVSYITDTPQEYDVPYFFPEAYTPTNPAVAKEEFEEIFSLCTEINKESGFPLTLMIRENPTIP